MKVVLDTNVLVSGLDPKDLFHAECSVVLQELLNHTMEALCPTLVLVETACVIRRRTKRESIAKAVCRYLATMPGITWIELLLPVAQEAGMLGARTGLRGGDAVVLHVAEMYGIPLVTKDKEIHGRTPAGVLVLDPKEIR